MSEKSQQSQDECVDVIDKLHELAHQGAFASMDASILRKFTSMLMSFFNVDITLDQASELFNKPKYTIKNNIYRKLPKADQPQKKTVIPYRKVEKILGK